MNEISRLREYAKENQNYLSVVLDREEELSSYLLEQEKRNQFKIVYNTIRKVVRDSLAPLQPKQPYLHVA